VQKGSGFEWSLLAASAVVQLFLLLLGWGDFGSLHGVGGFTVLLVVVGDAYGS
jgi:hypothetical protein